MANLKDTFTATPYIADDESIVYAPYDPELVRQLLDSGIAKAVIIPCSNMDAFNRFVQDIQDHHIEALKELAEIIIRDRSGRLVIHPGAFKKRKNNRISKPERESLTPFLWRQISSLFRILSSFPIEKEGFELNTLSREKGGTGFYPAFHIDGLTAHMTLSGATIEFLSHVDDEQIARLLSPKSKDEEALLLESRVSNDPQWVGRLHRTQPGDIIVWKEDFVHRSSPKIREQGQFALAVWAI